ncbi:uncharacterized protein LOC130663551 [Microplitis mediator]|uniref:uncharacterized protein LOC130663551 n=1 Tax=Microplitis mediator TaxID=375433 RepID=UPI002552FD3F|nr:uncharacterized protein LOC130663551 [Microplitis mediator]
MQSKCADDCAKSLKRRKDYEETLRGGQKSQDSENDELYLSDSTEYLSFARQKSSTSPGSSHPERSKKDTPKSRRVKKSYENQEQSEEDVRVSKTSARRRRQTSYAKRHSSRLNENCANVDCSGIPKRLVESEESEESLSSDISCPPRCDRDLTLLPKPSTPCDSSCPKQAKLDEERERHQEAVDKFLLHGGLRYFDDLCHCSLKCLLTQICGDQFVRKTASSTIFFILGVKLCFELEAWYIPF